MSSSTDLSNKLIKQHEDKDYSYDDYYKLIQTLPSNQGWGPAKEIKYGKFWYTPFILIATMAIQDTFQPEPTDILLVTLPKSGTTWIKAILFAIVNRTRFAFDNNHPLLAYNPHDCVPFLESIYNKNDGRMPLSQPRVLAMHAPYSALPLSLTHSHHRIVYLCRNPKDVLVSLWHFLDRVVKEGSVVPFEKAFELFCEGFSMCGPIWEHMLEYWTESLQRPEKVLFLKYEELKADTIKNVMRLAEFVGYPFSEEEVKEGVVEEIVNLCSFEKLSNVEVNKNGTYVGPDDLIHKNSILFRKGKVGDWKEHLTSEMAQKLEKTIEEKLHDSGLTFCS